MYKLTPEIQKIITTALGAGCTRSAAFGSAHISRNTFYRWMKEVEEFKDAVINAEADARVAIEGEVAKRAKDGDRLLLMYWLQNRYPEDWQDVRKFAVDNKVTLEDKRIGAMTDKEIFEELKAEGIDTSTFIRPEPDIESDE
jgi:hypothetical protein